MELIYLLQTSVPALVATSTVVGLLVGSFLNVVILRLPVMLMQRWQRDCRELAGMAGEADAGGEELNLVTPRSRCPHCGHQISALENIPVLSYLWLRGKCSACRKPIGLRYPAIELLSGALTGFVAWHFGFTLAGLAAALLTWALIALAFIDIDHQLLPDDIVLPFLWIGLLVNLAGTFANLANAVIGAVAGYLSLWLVFHAFRLLTGKEGMGYGDFKLFALFGAWLGWQSLPLIILLSSLVGAIVGFALFVFEGRDRAQPLPFGPYLAAAGWIALLWGNDLIRHYLQFARL